MIRIKNTLNLGRLPSEYQELDYIEDSGTQYIDTGVVNSSNIKVIDEMTLPSGVEKLSGCDDNQGTFYRYKWGTNGSHVLYIGYASTNMGSSITPNLSNWYRFTIGRGVQKIENVNTGEVYLNNTSTTSMTYSRTIILFGLHDTPHSKGVTTFSGTSRRRSTKIYNSDTLIRDFVPCYRKSDNEPGMYDLVNNVFYTNAGSGTFLIGNEVNKRDLNINPAIFNLPMARGYINGKLFYGEAPKQGRFVCVGESGKSYYSEDGETWATTSGSGSKDLGAVAYGNGRFVCVISSGSTANPTTAYYSTDGINWTASSQTGTAAGYNGVAYGNGRFVRVGSSGNSSYSTDGDTWTKMTGLSTAYSFYGVTFGNDRFVCVGTKGKSHYSTDGINWTAMSGLNSSYTYYGVTYGNDRFVTVGSDGYAYYSTNGTSWTKANRLGASYACRGIAYGNGIFVAIGPNGKSYYSTDGITWSDATTFGSGTFYGITYANGIFVVVGNSGYSYYSTDGVNWVAMTGLASATYNGVCYGEI